MEALSTFHQFLNPHAQKNYWVPGPGSGAGASKLIQVASDVSNPAFNKGPAKPREQQAPRAQRTPCYSNSLTASCLLSVFLSPPSCEPTAIEFTSLQLSSALNVDIAVESSRIWV